MKIILRPAAWCCLVLLLAAGAAGAQVDREMIYDHGGMTPTDSSPTLAPGDEAPGFTLPSLAGDMVSLADYKGKKNVVLSFVPAAWTPVCSDQWPGYNLARPIFEKHDAVLLGISVDNLPSQHAWTKAMGGLWFPVLSDFWPHGKVAEAYGVLRGDGVSDRTVVIIDKSGIIRYFEVTPIDRRPDLGVLAAELAKLP